MLGETLIGAMASLLIAMFLGPKFIDFLRRNQFGQQIREEGPEGHAVKAGTPTMGGLLIFGAVAVPFLILADYRDPASLAVFGTAVASAGLGFVDDWTKISKKRSLGVSARAKIVIQLAISVALWVAATQFAENSRQLDLWIVDASVTIPTWIYPILIFFVLAGASNGVNLTDGLDVLAAGCAAIVLMTYTAITFVSYEETALPLISACLVGGCVGFLWFNSFPAAIFMGDTGSLGLGGAVAALAVMTKTELLLIVIGGIFVIEALSVLIQVVSFQRFRRRVFLMAPVHHHFELMAWSETKIILRFWIVAAIFAAIGFTLFQQSTQ
ncbi:MAG: phospho-N-acetylmuramoyl-pentapeptide-transferase [Thermoleophilaceae bacterium]